MFATYIIYTCFRRHIIVCTCSQNVDVNLVKWRSVACEAWWHMNYIKSYLWTLNLISWPIITTSAEVTPCLGISVICTDYYIYIYIIYISQQYLIDNMYISTYIYIYTYLITWQASGRVSVTCIPDLLPRCHLCQGRTPAQRGEGGVSWPIDIAGQSGLTPIEFPIE